MNDKAIEDISNQIEVLDRKANELKAKRESFLKKADDFTFRISHTFLPFFLT